MSEKVIKYSLSCFKIIIIDEFYDHIIPFGQKRRRPKSPQTYSALIHPPSKTRKAFVCQHVRRAGARADKYHLLEHHDSFRKGLLRVHIMEIHEFQIWFYRSTFKSDRGNVLLWKCPSPCAEIPFRTTLLERL